MSKPLKAFDAAHHDHIIKSKKNPPAIANRWMGI